MIKKINPNPRAIDYWEKVLSSPTSAFKELLEEEQQYLESQVAPDDHVLDVCCGSGRNLQSLQKITKNVHGIDNDLRAIKLGIKKGLGEKITEEDALHTPFPDKAFDIVVMLDSLINFKEKKIDALKEMARIAKDEGKIIISVYSEDAFDTRKEMYEKIGARIISTRGTTFIFDGEVESEQFTREELQTMAEKAGLEILECKKVGNLAYLVQLAKKKPR